MARSTQTPPLNSEKTLSKDPAVREVELLIRECSRCKSGKKCEHQIKLKQSQKEGNEAKALIELKKAKKKMRKRII